MARAKYKQGKFYASVVEAEKRFWERALKTCPKPLTVRRLAKHVGASPMTVSRRLRLLGYRRSLGYRLELRLTKRPTR